MIQTVLLRAQSRALTALAVVLVLFGAYALGGRRARKAEEARSAAERARRDLDIERGNSAAREAAIEAGRTRRDADAAADAMAPGEAQDRLRNQWSRD